MSDTLCYCGHTWIQHHHSIGPGSDYCLVRDEDEYGSACQCTHFEEEGT
jgi:hypothetical protein